MPKATDHKIRHSFNDRTPHLPPSGGDSHFDISSDGYNLDIIYHATPDTWTGETTTSFTQGDDARVWFDIDVGHIEKVTTLLFLAANETMNYNATMGTEPTGDDQLRYTGESKFYVVSVAMSEPYGPLSEGLNVLLVPQSVYYGSSAFSSMIAASNPSSIGGFMPDTTVWSFPGDQRSAYPVMGTVSLELDATEAENLLWNLLHDADGVKTAWYADVTDCVYTVGLPHAVVGMIGVEVPVNPVWNSSGGGSRLGAFMEWGEDFGNDAWNYICDNTPLGDLIVAFGQWGFIEQKVILYALQFINPLVQEGRDALIEVLKEGVDRIVLPALDRVVDGISMDFFEGQNARALSIAMGMASSSYTEKEIMAQAASPGYDDIMRLFKPLLEAAGKAMDLFRIFDGPVYRAVESYLNDLMREGVIGIVNRIVPLDPEYEGMIRNASEGDVDPEVRWAAENMTAELDFGSKEGFIGSVIDSYSAGEGDEEGEGTTTYQMQSFYQGPTGEGRKIALLIGQGDPDGKITEAVHNDMTSL